MSQEQHHSQAPPEYVRVKRTDAMRWRNGSMNAEMYRRRAARRGVLAIAAISLAIATNLQPIARAFQDTREILGLVEGRPESLRSLTKPVETPVSGEIQSPTSSPSSMPIKIEQPIPDPIVKKTEPPYIVDVVGQSAMYSGYSENEVYTMEHCGNQSDRVLLTFDDGGSPEHVQKITDFLIERNIGAIFFPISNEFSTERVDELRQQGFWVGNHSYSHPLMHSLSDKEIETQQRKGVDANLYRPPGGATYLDKDQHGDEVAAFDNRVEETATRLGARICMWTIDPRDWSGKSAREIVKDVESELGDGSVVLLHMRDAYNTLAALPGIVKAVKANGLELCQLPDEPTTRDIPAVLPC